MNAEWLAAVPLALGGAASFGGAGLLQHRAARSVPDRGPLRPGLLRDLTRVATFRWGVLLSASGFGLQVAALRFAPLPVVQPLLVTGVLFYLAFASVFLGHAIDLVLTLGALLALAGLTTFLVAARPEPGGVGFGQVDGLWLAVSVVVVVGACLLASRLLSDPARALPVAIATAACYGATAGLVRSLLVGGDGGAVLTRWELYAALVLGPAGFLLNQNAFQEGAVGSVAVATITVGDPVFSILIGVMWLGDTLAAGPIGVVLEAIGLMMVAGGVVILTGRAQRVADQIKRVDAAHDGDLDQRGGSSRQHH